jgi:hypothetical protein
MKNFKYMLFISIAIVTGVLSCVSKPNASIFILAGQSNMSGRGKLDLVKPQLDSLIMVFGNDYTWKVAKEPIDSPKNQKDSVSIDLKAGFSPGLSFAKEYRRLNSNSKIGIVPCAKGGTAISEWAKGTPLYTSMIKRAKEARKKGKLEGILFFQGETDAGTPGRVLGKELYPDSWDVHFKQFVLDVREDLEDTKLLVVFAQIGTTSTPEKFTNWEVVQEKQASVNMENVMMIKTKDLTLGDWVHFNTESYKEIGKRFAKKVDEHKN